MSFSMTLMTSKSGPEGPVIWTDLVCVHTILSTAIKFHTVDHLLKRQALGSTGCLQHIGWTAISEIFGTHAHVVRQSN